MKTIQTLESTRTVFNLRRLFATLGMAACCTGAAMAQTPKSAACPAPVPQDARCFTGEDGQGSFYWIALPAGWTPQGVLVMHAHGGPEPGKPTLERAEEDLKRWAITVRAGYAWAGSSYRRGGYGVTMAVEDTERLRKIFVESFGQPRRTVLHGQSYGGAVASKAIDIIGPQPGRPSAYDAVLLTSGVLGGGSNAYEFRLDLRAVYQAVCGNHPRQDEAQYPLWMGLPAGASMSRSDLADRVKACTGVGMPAAERTPEQRARLAQILSAVKVPERTLVAHLQWATGLFQDLIQTRLGGRNPFGNEGVVYAGGSELNGRVPRYAADPQAVAALAADSLPSGRLGLPVLTVHAIHDPTAFVELESAYREIVQQAGSADMLVQTFVDESEHSYLSDPEYPALFKSLLDWVEQGSKPSPRSVSVLCEQFLPSFGSAKEGCHFRPDFQPAALATRVPARAR